jgi:adenylate cyclase
MLFREGLRHFKIYFVVGFIFMALAVSSRMILAVVYGISDPGYETIQAFGELEFSFLMTFLSAFLLALLSSLLDIIVLKRLVKTKSLGIALLIGFLAQAAMVILVVRLMLRFYGQFMSSLSTEAVPPPKFLDILFILVYLIAAVALSKLLIEIDRKLGPGNLWKVLSGKFFKPREEERIFMFIDMRGSTTIAEKLGHLEFSKLIRDVFRDFSIVDRYRTDIYQYVGDEVVVSWSPKNGFKNDNFLKAFFAFSNLLKNKSEYYQKNYGMDPYFKAGANFGPVIITEVGDIKREITYHGDTLNTAARIQGMCNDLEAQMLIPESVYELVKDTAGFQIDDVGCIALKGKQKEVRLYRVTQN